MPRKNISDRLADLMGRYADDPEYVRLFDLEWLEGDEAKFFRMASDYVRDTEEDSLKLKHAMEQEFGIDLGPDYTKEESIDKIIDDLLNEEMEVYEPSKKDRDKSLAALRDFLKVKGKPTNTTFLTMRKGKSNKFIYFAMFKDGRKYVAGNAYGRIGYEPKVSKIGAGFDSELIKSAMDKKIAAKKKKGYK